MATEQTVDRGAVTEFLTSLRHERGFDMLIDLTAVDLAGKQAPGRFCVVYQLYSTASRQYLRVKCYLPEEDPVIPTASTIWPAAGWAEREVWDMFGIRFEGHPDPRRILLPENYGSFPLRKEYPVKGLGERDRFPKYFR